MISRRFKYERRAYRAADSNKQSAEIPSSESEGGASVKEPAVRMLMVINDRTNLNHAITYLERLNYEVSTVQHVSDLVAALQKVRPQVVLVSWNLKGTNVRKVYRLLIQKFRIPCIVFAEGMDTRTNASLMSSGIPGTLLAPLSGASVHMRVQSLTKKKTRTKKSLRQEREEMRQIAVEAKDLKISEASPWIQIENTDNAEELLWQNTASATEEGSSLVYYFKGEKPPYFDSITQQWTVEKGKTPIYMEERAEVTEYSAIQEGMAEGEAFEALQINLETDELEAMIESPPDASVNWNTEAAKLQDEMVAIEKGEDFGHVSNYQDKKQAKSAGSVIDMSTKRPTPVVYEETQAGIITTQAASSFDSGKKATKNFGMVELGSVIRSRDPKQADSILAKAVRSALVSVTKSTSPPTTAIGRSSKVTVAQVFSPRFCGYVVTTNSQNRHQVDLVKQVMTVLEQELKAQGEPLLAKVEILDVELEGMDFMAWAEGTAEFVVTAAEGDQTVAFAFFPTAGHPEVIEVDNSEVLGVSLSRDLRPDTKLLFDLYLYLPKNNKYLCYVTRDHLLTSKTVGKFDLFKIRVLYIRKSDKERFLTYCAQNAIVSSLLK